MTSFEHMPVAEKSEVQKWIDWAKQHQEMVFVGGMVVLLIAIGIPYYIHSQTKANDDAQGVFSLAQYYQHAGVDPKNGPFKSEDEKNQQALSTYQRVVNDFAGTPTAKLARYFVAKDQLLLRQNAMAYSSFDTASQELKGTPWETKPIWERLSRWKPIISYPKLPLLPKALPKTIPRAPFIRK